MQDPFRFLRHTKRHTKTLRGHKEIDPYTEYVQRSRPEIARERRKQRIRALAYIVAAVILGILLAIALNRT